MSDAASVARKSDVDAVAAYFLGATGASAAELAIVLGLVALGAVGGALIAVGYRLITTLGMGERAATY